VLEIDGMSEKTTGFWRGRAKSFANAGRGIALVVKTQTNAKIHALVTLLVLGAGAGLHISGSDWALLILAMGLVWSAEAFNTALELLADAVHPEPHPLVGQAKDVAAGAVLIAAVAAAGIGILVLGPYFLAFFR
jgi:diacylglycerol kinase